jgi:MurNAc alpha-1-phosphate uridylyltransferase
MRAMILAAGRGERMRPLTDKMPKPLLPVGGKPLIVWHIERLVRAGITEIIINHAWLGYMLESALQDGESFGAHITYSPEPAALETAGGIARALPFFNDEPFLVVNGDIWCDWDPCAAKQIGRSLRAGDKLAWLLLADNPGHHAKGDFILDAGGHVSDRGSSGSCASFTFTGIGVYMPGLFASLEKNRAAALAPLLRAAMSKEQIIGDHYNGVWIDVGTPERLSALDASLRN